MGVIHFGWLAVRVPSLGVTEWRSAVTRSVLFSEDLLSSRSHVNTARSCIGI